MRVWLDDVRPMPEGFDLHVMDAVAAIAALRTGKVTFMSFDHDLGKDDTGYTVAKWIEEEAQAGRIPRLFWQIHSANPVGQKNMEAALTNADKFWGA